MSAMMPWMRRSQDELISAYIDGQLDDASRQSFEARIAADPALRKRVEATRTLVQTAHQTPAVAAPRNFTLPRTATAATATHREVPSSRSGWRIGSALAAAVFVIAIGLDTIGVGQLAQSPAPNAAPVTQSYAAKTPAPTPNRSAESTQAVQDSTGGSAANQSTAATVEPAATAAPAPTIVQAPTRAFAAAARGISGTGASQIAPNPTLLEPTATSTDEAATKTIMGGGQPTQLLEPAATPTDEAAALQAPREITATVEGAIEAPAKTIITPQTAPPQPDVDILRITALVALGAAIVAGIIGWTRR